MYIYGSYRKHRKIKTTFFGPPVMLVSWSWYKLKKDSSAKVVK